MPWGEVVSLGGLHSVDKHLPLYIFHVLSNSTTVAQKSLPSSVVIEFDCSYLGAISVKDFRICKELIKLFLVYRNLNTIHCPLHSYVSPGD